MISGFCQCFLFLLLGVRWSKNYLGFLFFLVFIMNGLSPAFAQQTLSTLPVISWTHSSGMQVILLEDQRTEYVSVELSILTGSRYDPVGKAGLVNLTGEMLFRGTETKNYKQLSEAFDFLGSEIDIDTDNISLTIDGDTIKRNREAFFELLAEVILKPAFVPEELNSAKRDVENEILINLDEDEDVCRLFFKRMLFHDKREGRPSEGFLRDLRAISVDDVNDFYRQHFYGSNMILGVAGAVSEKELKELIGAYFSDLPQSPAKEPVIPSLQNFTGREVVLVDRDERSQTQIMLGHLGPPPTDSDTPALKVALTAFGGSFTARMMSEIRVKRGLSYGAYSHLIPYPEYSVIRLWTFPSAETTVETLQITLELYDELAVSGITDEELEFAKNYLIDGFPRTISTAQEFLHELIRGRQLGLPDQDLFNFRERIAKVTRDDVIRAINNHLTPKQLVIVVLCTAKPFATLLDRLDGITSTTVVRYDEE